jgi:glycine C-acetyltransferase
MLEGSYITDGGDRERNPMAFDGSMEHFRRVLDEIRGGGMWKEERFLTTPQRPRLDLRPDRAAEPRPALNLCANNYLGLADHPEVIDAACRATRDHGFGMSSVRFICGTHELHRRLEDALSAFLGAEDTILYTSCFDANGGLFETVLGPEDVVLTDELNHASIIDGIRLSKARRRIFKHSDTDDLRAGLEEAAGARARLIATDGVFSMHGDLARLREICDLADAHRALVMVDDSHATGFIGKRGRGTPERFDVAGRVDVVTSTLGKALGGGVGGFTAGRREIIALLRQRSRPYLFSNSLPPGIAAGALKALEIVDREPERIERLRANTTFFREAIAARGFRIAPGDHPIVPIVLGEEKKTVEMAAELFRQGVFVVGFTYPVVPRGQARIRVQLSAAHEREDLERAVGLFAEVGKRLGLV